jgi:Domain of unknown function (DUF4328)
MIYKPLDKTYKLLRLLLKTNIVFNILSVLVCIYGIVSYSRMLADADVSEAFLSSDVLFLILLSLQLIIVIFLSITFLQWIYRINMNLHLLSFQEMRFSPGWSIGWYFIPVANLFKPYQTMKEIWDVSHNHKNHDYSLLHWWWFLFLFGGIASNFGPNIFGDANNSDEYVKVLIVYIASNLFYIVLNAVALSLVTKISEAYLKNHD